jgi:WD40 repeat protein
MGTTSFTGSSDGTVRAWNSATGEQIALLELHARANDLDLSTNGQSLVIATGEPDPQIRRVDAATLETREIMRQQQPVSAVVLLKDDSHVAAAWGRTVAVFDLRTGLTEFTVEPHSGNVRSLAASQNGRWLASGSDDHSVALIDAATGQTIRHFNGHLDDVLDVAFSPDDTLLASVSTDGTVRIWKTESAESLATLYPYLGATYAVNAVAFSPDGQNVVAGSDGSHGRGRIRAWNTTDFSETLQLQLAANIVRSLDFSANGKHMVVGNEDCTATVWDFPRSLEDREHTIDDAAEIARPGGPGDLRNDAVGFRKWYVNVKHKRQGILTHGKSLATLGTRSDVWSVAWSPSGHRIASGGFRQVRLIDPAVRTSIDASNDHASFVYASAFSRTGSQFVSAEGDLAGQRVARRPKRTLNLIRSDNVWDVQRTPLLSRGSETEDDVQGPDNDTGEIVWLDDDRLLLIDGSSMGRSDQLQVRSAINGEFVDTWLADSDEGYASAAISPDWKIVAIGGGDYFRLHPGDISLINAQSGQLLVRLQGHRMPVTGLFFMPDGNTLVSTSVDMTVRLWDVATGTQTRVLEVTSPVGRTTLHPDSGRFSLSCFDGTVRIWETETWQEVAKLPRTHDFEAATLYHENYGAERSGEINGLTFSPDGNTLLVG